MFKAILKKNPLLEPCPHCGGIHEIHYVCSICHKEFCANCFIEIPNGDGTSVQCPNTDCEATLQLPPSI
jgi:hypothetical protein